MASEQEVNEQIEDLEDAAKDQLSLAAGNEALAKENREVADDQMQLAKGHEALAKENRQQAKDWQREADQLKRGRSFVRNEQALEDLETKSLGLPAMKAVTREMQQMRELIRALEGTADIVESEAKELDDQAEDLKSAAKEKRREAKNQRKEATDLQRELNRLERQ